MIKKKGLIEMNQHSMNLHDLDVKGLIKTLDVCRGDVFLETPEGDVLNLKSKLCQLTGVFALIEGGVINDATIRCEKPEDEALLFRFNLYKEVPESK